MPAFENVSIIRMNTLLSACVDWACRRHQSGLLRAQGQSSEPSPDSN